MPLEIAYIKAPIKNWCRYNLSSGISCRRIIEKIHADQYYGFPQRSGWLSNCCETCTEIKGTPAILPTDCRVSIRPCQILIGRRDRKLSCRSVRVLFNTFFQHGGTWFITTHPARPPARPPARSLLLLMGGSGGCITLRHCQARLGPHMGGVWGRREQMGTDARAVKSFRQEMSTEIRWHAGVIC